ncbi:MAG: hypothetical protein RR022_01775 [Angelakisella sp.]
MPLLTSKRTRIGESISRYLQTRGSIFTLSTLFIGGLLVSSLFCISGSESSTLLLKIVVNELNLQKSRTFLQLLLSATTSFAWVFVLIYLCVNSRKGALMVFAIPVLYGLAIGSLITAVLVNYGYAALDYIAVCIFIPKFFETLLLLSICNKAARYCRTATGSGRRRREDELPLALYLILFAGCFLLEGGLLWLFRGMLYSSGFFLP